MRISPLSVAGSLIVAWMLSVGSAAHAGTVALNTLLVSGASFTSGDKVFTNFVYTGRTNDMPLAASVSITDIVISGDFGIRIQGTFQDLPGAGNSTVTLQYTVTATAPGYTIVGARMSGDPVLAGGGQFVTVKEVFAQNASDLNVFADIESSTQTSDSESFLSQPSLNVTTTFTARATVSGSAKVTTVEQTFTQGLVPEPGSLALLGFGVVAVGFCSGRRRSKAGKRSAVAI